MESKFGVGMRVRIKGLKHPGTMQYNGAEAVISSKLGTWAAQSGPMRNTHRLVTQDGEELILAPAFLELVPPKHRGDLDTKVSWKELEATTGYKRRPEDLV